MSGFCWDFPLLCTKWLFIQIVLAGSIQGVIGWVICHARVCLGKPSFLGAFCERSLIMCFGGPVGLISVISHCAHGVFQRRTIYWDVAFPCNSCMELSMSLLILLFWLIYAISFWMKWHKLIHCFLILPLNSFQRFILFLSFRAIRLRLF